MKGLHVEVALLAALFVLVLFVVVAAPHLGTVGEVMAKLLEWGGLILGALLALLTGRNARP